MNTCKYCNQKYAPTRKDQKFCSISHALKHRYANGFKPNTEKAHETLRTKGHYKRDNTYLKTNNPAKSPEARIKISDSKMGNKNAMYGIVGDKHHNWSGGKNKTIWKSVEYQRWRKSVMRRDNFTCVECGDNKGGNLEADHIKPKYLFPELTFVIDNGRTLCVDCHKATKTWGQKVKSLSRADFA